MNRKGLCVILAGLLLTLSGCDLLSNKGNRVVITREGENYTLTLNDKPFYIQGVGLGEAFGKKGENYLALAKELGANTVRTWGVDQGTQKYLDEAHRQGLYVNAGIWINNPDPKKGISYVDGAQYMKDKEKEALDYVRRFKRHPAILSWNIGNECIFFSKDLKEKEAMCRFMDRLNQMVKKEDPDHPIIYASVNSLDLPYLKKWIPSLDVIGMNVYGSVIGSQSGWQSLDFGKPYVITEFGPLGPWDLPKDAHGKMREQDDYTKAQQYKNHWSLIRERKGKNIGGFVFHLGETTQESLTQWNLNDSMLKKEPFVVMQKMYGAPAKVDHAPRIREFKAPATVKAGEPFEVRIVAEDAEGSPLTYEYRASTSTQDVLQYYVNVPIEVEVKGQGPQVTMIAPKTPGIYRIYGFVKDNAGRSSSASRAILIQE